VEVERRQRAQDSCSLAARALRGHACGPPSGRCRMDGAVDRSVAARRRQKTDWAVALRKQAADM